MKKLLSFVAILLFAFSINTNAQSISIQGLLGLPMGDFGDGYGIGFGGTATFVYPITSTVDLTGTAGYESFGGKDALEDFTTSIIPILVGGRIAFGENTVTPYFDAALGLFMSSASGEIGGVNFETDTESNFGIRGGFGVLVPVNSVSLDLGANFDLITSSGNSTTFIGFDLGVNIPFN